MVLSRYPHMQRLVMMADRGLLSVDNVAYVASITLYSGLPFEFALVVPGRRYEDFVELLQPFHDGAAAETESISKTR
jgi:hypothetical protein